MGRYADPAAETSGGGGYFDFSASHGEKAFQESLDRLQVDYVDLLQLHDVEYADWDQLAGETVPFLQELKASGRVRAIGVNGYSVELLDKLAGWPAFAGFDTVLSYGCFTLQNPGLRDAVPRLRAANPGVGVLNASPLALGLLTPQGPPNWHPASPEVKAACAAAAELCAARGTKDIAALGLDFCLAEESIAVTISGACSPEEVRQCTQRVGASLDAALIQEGIDTIGAVHGKQWGPQEGLTPVLDWDHL